MAYSGDLAGLREPGCRVSSTQRRSLGEAAAEPRLLGFGVLCVEGELHPKILLQCRCF